MISSTQTYPDFIDWLDCLVKRRQAVAELPMLQTVKDLAKRYDPTRLNRLGVYLESGLDDVRLWLKVILKIGTLMNLHDPVSGVTTLVGLYPASSLHQTTRNVISSDGVVEMRRALGVERHWVLLLDGRKLPRDFELFDAFYGVLDRGDDCCEIDFR